MSFFSTYFSALQLCIHLTRWRWECILSVLYGLSCFCKSVNQRKLAKAVVCRSPSSFRLSLFFFVLYREREKIMVLTQRLFVFSLVIIFFNPFKSVINGREKKKKMLDSKVNSSFLLCLSLSLSNHDDRFRLRLLIIATVHSDNHEWAEEYETISKLNMNTEQVHIKMRMQEKCGRTRREKNRLLLTEHRLCSFECVQWDYMNLRLKSFELSTNRAINEWNVNELDKFQSSSIDRAYILELWW